MGVAHQTTSKTTRLVLHGSVFATGLLAILLVVFDLISDSLWFSEKTWIVFIAFFYLFLAEFLLYHKHHQTVNWMLVMFYEALAFLTLLTWGLNSSVGILTLSFAVILPSILMGAHSVLLIISIAVLTLIIVQLIHYFEIITPSIKLLAEPSTLWDVGMYSTILSIFALVSWLSSRQRERSLSSVVAAEQALQNQKEELIIDLEKESALLRLTQLKQIRELHQFAFLGQAAAATLHELSNHLSVLNLDMSDLQQQNSQTKALSNAKESIEHINKMVRQTKHQLSSYNQRETFNAIPVLNRNLKDMRNKFVYRHVKLSKTTDFQLTNFKIDGSPFALMQIVTIILNNALDACYDTAQPEVIVHLETNIKDLKISIKDNGPGIDPVIYKSLFNPVTSTKPSGMGVGLYIAKHLTEDHFGGTIQIKASETGALFIVTIPRTTKNTKR